MLTLMKKRSFIEQIPKRKRDAFEKRVRGLIEEAFRTASDPNMEGHLWRGNAHEDGTVSLNPHNPDWCHAFGMVQGMALSVGYDMWDGMNEDSARFWFDTLTVEISRKYHAKIQQATINGDFEPRCACGKKLITSAKCPNCDNDE